MRILLFINCRRIQQTWRLCSLTLHAGCVDVYLHTSMKFLVFGKLWQENRLYVYFLWVTKLKILPLNLAKYDKYYSRKQKKFHRLSERASVLLLSCIQVYMTSWLLLDKRRSGIFRIIETVQLNFKKSVY